MYVKISQFLYITVLCKINAPSSVVNITVVPRAIPELILMKKLEVTVFQLCATAYRILNFTFTNINSSPTTQYMCF